MSVYICVFVRVCTCIHPFIYLYIYWIYDFTGVGNALFPVQVGYQLYLSNSTEFPRATERLRPCLRSSSQCVLEAGLDLDLPVPEASWPSTRPCCYSLTLCLTLSLLPALSFSQSCIHDGRALTFILVATQTEISL